MGFIVTRLRAAACSGIAVATLLSLTPAASAATGAPSDELRPEAAATAMPIDGLGPELRTDRVRDSLLTIFTPPALLTTGPADLSLLPTAVAARPASTSAAARVISAARSHLGARYAFGAQGPHRFDCSGLVLRAYADSGLVKLLGGWGNRSGYALYAYGRRHLLVSTTGGQPGDVVVWGGGGHVGIYLGNGMAISALVSGVRIHGIHAVTKRFTAFIHTRLAGNAGAGTHRPSTAPATSASQGTAAKQVRYATVTLRLRAAAATSATIVRTLSSGTRVIVQDTARDAHHRVWYHVKVAGRTGWVAGWLTRI